MWQERSIMEQRQEFVVLASAEGANVSALRRRFGISRETGHKWIVRYRTGGKEAMEDLSRRPRASPERTGASMEQSIPELRDKHPAWGGRKLRARLVAFGKQAVTAASTITQILRRQGRLDEEHSGPHTAFKRFERSGPNQLWQMDFKGHVAMRSGARCHPLTILDDHSRFSIDLRACGNEQSLTVRRELTEVFRRYGLPEMFLCDNGPPWGAFVGVIGHTRLTIWLLRLGINVCHGRPWHPQAQGKQERFHRTLKAEVLQRRELRGLKHAQHEFDAWRDVCNLERPNEAIGMVVPSARYQPSERAYPEKLPELEFSPDDQVRRVGRNGQLCYRGQRWCMGGAFVGEPLGARTNADGKIEVRYGPYVGALLDTASARDKQGRLREPAPLETTNGGG
jgi:transposase InsO family protein